MALAKVRYPKRIDPLRWCSNGLVPDAFMIRQVAWALNHVIAYRPKVFGTWGDLDNAGTVVGASGTTTYYRFHCRTRVLASEMVFRIGMGLDPHDSGTDPTVDIDVTESGGSTTSVSLHYGLSSTGSDGDAPYTIRWAEARIPVSGATSYEVAIKGSDYGRPLCWTAYDFVDPEVDPDLGYYVGLAPTIQQPIYDSFREQLLTRASQVWLANGPQLITWPGRGTGSSTDIRGTTWTNAVDASSTSVSSSTPGFDIGSTAGTGALAVSSLAPLLRYSHGTSLPVTFAVYASTDTGSTGAVRLQDSGGTLASITTIGTTAQWYTTDTTISSSTTKIDLQLRNGTAGQTTRLHAACLYVRSA